MLGRSCVAVACLGSREAPPPPPFNRSVSMGRLGRGVSPKSRMSSRWAPAGRAALSVMLKPAANECPPSLMRPLLPPVPLEGLSPVPARGAFQGCSLPGVALPLPLLASLECCTCSPCVSSLPRLLPPADEPDTREARLVDAIPDPMPRAAPAASAAATAACWGWLELQEGPPCGIPLEWAGPPLELPLLPLIVSPGRENINIC